jgi:glycosyltransferase involved in cell wall biosynthesis
VTVAFFLTSFHPGGTERQMVELARRLDPARFRVHFACFHREGAWLPRAAERADSIAEFPLRGFAHPSAAEAALRFARWCRAERLAVLQTCDLYANTFGLPAAAVAGVPVRVGSRREINPDKTPAQIRLQALAFRAAHSIVANSSTAARALEAEGVPRERIEIIRNGLDPGAFTPRVFDGAPRTLLVVANLRPEKAHDVLFRATADLVTRHPRLRLRVVGDGPARAALEALARSLRLDRVVEFLGHREDVPAIAADSDIFVLPSRSEASPNAVIEAMAAGLPIVATDVGGIPELVDHERNGLLVPPDRPAALAAAVERLVTAPDLAARLGAEGRRRAERHSFDRMAASFERLYLSRLASRPEFARVAS